MGLKETFRARHPGTQAWTREPTEELEYVQSSRRIDHIMLTDEVAKHLATRIGIPNGYALDSDHFPVVCDIPLNTLKESLEMKIRGGPGGNRTRGEIRRSGASQHNSHPTGHRQLHHARKDPSAYRQYVTAKQIDSTIQKNPRYQRPDALVCRNIKRHYHPSEY